MAIPIRIEYHLKMADGTTTVKRYNYSPSERSLAMDQWDRMIDSVQPGEMLRLINASNERVVSEFTNRKSPSGRGEQV